MNPVQVTRDPKLLPSSDCSVACVKRAGGLSLYWMPVCTPTKGSPRNCKRKCGLENETLVFQSRVRKLGRTILHKVTLKKKRVTTSATDVTKRLEVNSLALMKLN